MITPIGVPVQLNPDASYLEQQQHMQNDMEADILYIEFVTRMVRLSLFGLNILVFMGTFYFMVTGDDLFGHPLDMHIAWVITIGVLVDAVAVFGVVTAMWWGKLKTRMRIALFYALTATLTVFLSFVATVFLDDITGADILLIVIVTVHSICLLAVAYVYAYLVHKLRLIKKVKKQGKIQRFRIIG